MDASSRVSPLRQRMIDDMRMRKLSEKTQSHYLRWVQRFAAYLGRSPDTATVEDLRGYQLHLVDHGTSPVSLNAAITGLKFFFEVTLDRGELMAKMQPVRVPRTLPVVFESGRGGAAHCSGTQPEGANGAVGGLRDGSARQRGGGAEGHRHR